MMRFQAQRAGSLCASRQAELVSAAEFVGRPVEVQVDRPLGSPHPEVGFAYPVNHGFVHGVAAPDGDELDAFVLGVPEPRQWFVARCIAVVHRLDDDDDKLVVVPDGVQMSDAEIRQLTHFQEQYFDSTIRRA
jgi:inorganic pyrophosphatase